MGVKDLFDLGKLDGIPALVDAVLGKYGGIDILVNNAGVEWSAPAVDHPLDAWNKVMNLNVTAMFVMSQNVARKAMIPQRSGKIINIASIAGLSGRPSDMKTVAYSTSKAAAVNLRRSLASEWGRGVSGGGSLASHHRAGCRGRWWGLHHLSCLAN